ncbi:hypothetical protein V4R08_07835 [Nitrobacter sp. NHB1]|uniref:hypothetical protein n=1 Tax=Nitrobacter sp. NHB1 TaxID=3119830 RepID=UPI00300085CD
MTGPSWAQSAAADAPDSPAEQITSAADPSGDAAVDWSQLDIDGYSLATEAAPQVRRSRRSSQPASNAGLAWSSHDNADGSAALTAKRSVSPLWDARVGVDMTVVHQPSPLTASDLATDKQLAIDGRPPQSSGTAWAAATAPGIGSIWDKTALTARIDPAQDQTMLDTSLSKSLPLDDGRYGLTLQNGYNVVQHSALPIPGINGHPARSYETDQSAKLSMADTGTSLIAGRSLSSADDKWLRTIGAEQKLYDGVSVTGSISETPLGPLNASLTAAFNRNW